MVLKQTKTPKPSRTAQRVGPKGSPDHPHTLAVRLDHEGGPSIAALGGGDGVLQDGGRQHLWRRVWAGGLPRRSAEGIFPGEEL